MLFDNHNLNYQTTENYLNTGLMQYSDLHSKDNKYPFTYLRNSVLLADSLQRVEDVIESVKGRRQNLFVVSTVDTIGKTFDGFLIQKNLYHFEASLKKHSC